MHGLTSLELYNPVFDITKEKTFETSKSKKKEKRYSLEDAKSHGEKFRPDDVKDETLGPDVIEKPKEIEFDDRSIVKKYYIQQKK